MPEHLHPGGYDPSVCPKFKRHDHPYTVTGRAARRCTCGSRRWKVKAGGPLPVTVFCESCHRENRTATAYEEGRLDALAG
jgi:hypothetical protein